MMAAAMTMGLAACGSTASTDTAASAADTASSTEAAASTADSTAAADGKVYNIGICQLVQHEALDAATQGFKDALVEKLGEGSVKFDEQNASGDSANCATIVNGFVSNGVDLILANATAPLQAAAQATADIPVLGTSITDYATALDISDWTGTVGNNISGTSDLAPLDQQAAMIQELFPDAKSVGLLYCSAEPNSVYQCDVIEGYLNEEATPLPAMPSPIRTTSHPWPRLPPITPTSSTSPLTTPQPPTPRPSQTCHSCQGPRCGR